jgi:ABC-2 type transport system ATP-binding protein
MDDAIVEIRGLKKIFRDFWRRPKVNAVDDIDLNIPEGKIFGLLGPNGSGKSTTIKIILGLLNPSAGSVKIFNSSPRDVKIKNHIGYLPEESYLYNYLTPRETLDFYGKLFNLDKQSLKKRSSQLLDMVGLTQSADRPVGEFSKGMARRVGLAQALINDPKLIIMDEPTSGLDPIGCREVKDMMLMLKKRGKTVILCSHLLADVEDVCDSITILYNGKIRACGSVNELLEKQEKIRLTLPSLPPDEMKRLLAFLKDKIRTEAEIDHPTINLEEFFLKVIEDAYKSTTHQSGVSRTEGMAEFLKKP